MIIFSNSYTKKHVIGGSGMVDTIKNILRSAATSKASKSSLAVLNKMASSELGREAITAAKSAGKEFASSAISTAKDVAIDKGKKAIVSMCAITKTPNPATSDPILTKKSKDIISELVKSGVSDKRHEAYEPMLGGSVKKKVTKENAIRIQDLIKNSRILLDSKNLRMGSGMMMRE